MAKLFVLLSQEDVSNQSDYDSYELNTFSVKYRHFKVVITDEISMDETRTELYTYTSMAIDTCKSLV